MTGARQLLAVVAAVAAVAAAAPARAQPHEQVAMAAPGSPVRAAVVTADLASADQLGPGPATGEAAHLAGCSPTGRPGPTSGEGVVAVTMAGPGTSWGSPTATAVVVDIAVDGGQPQQLVLFAGAEPFTYTGFVGELGRGRHCVTIAVRPDLSNNATPEATVYDVELGVVPRSAAGWLLASHAPVLYGRSTSAVGDTPLLTYGQQTDHADGTSSLAYTVIWTHEDVGTGIVAADLWGSWGRLTDIETVLHETVDSGTGQVVKATYLSCGCEQLPVYPDASNELPPSGETQRDFHGSWSGQHAVLRDATGNNDESDQGTTAFRFQQSLVAPPSPGQVREAAMDAHPWTYRISNEEIAREQVTSSDPRTVLPGDYRQYLIADIDAAPTGTASVAVEVQVRGDPTWYSNDYAQMSGGVPSTYPFYVGGHGRTVVKLPPDWLSRGLTAVRLRLNVPPGSSPAPELNLHALTLLGLSSEWRVVPLTAQPTRTTAVALIPVPVG